MKAILESGDDARISDTNRRGFTLIEVVVAAVILAMLAAITVPQVMDALDKKRIQDTADMLAEVRYAFTNSDQTGFIQVVRTTAATATTSVVPGKLSELVNPVVSGDLNSCATTFASNVVKTTWTSFGPFLNRDIFVSTLTTNDALRTPIGNFQNTMTRTLAVQATWTNPVSLQLQIPSVDVNDAEALDLVVDGVAGAAAGAIRYQTTAGVTKLQFLIPIPNRC